MSNVQIAVEKSNRYSVVDELVFYNEYSSNFIEYISRFKLVDSFDRYFQLNDSSNVVNTIVNYLIIEGLNEDYNDYLLSITSLSSSRFKYFLYNKTAVQDSHKKKSINQDKIL